MGKRKKKHNPLYDNANEWWKDPELLVTRYIWAPIYNPDSYIPSSLLQMKDRNGQTPGIFGACSAQRGPGKTFSFTYKLIRDFFDSDYQCKFYLFTRNQNHLGSIADGRFKTMLQKMFPEWKIREQVRQHGKYSDVYLYQVHTEYEEDKDGNEVAKEVVTEYHCGYVLPINAYNFIKDASSKFTDAYQWFFDEFQPVDDNDYLPGEPTKFKMIYQSIARGAEGKEHFRVVPGYMCSNTISVLSDYFEAFDMSNKIQPDTRKYRGNGVVFEFCEVAGLTEKQQADPVLRALSEGDKNKYVDKFRDDRWLNDNNTNVVKRPKGWGSSVYIATLVIGDHKYGVRYFRDKDWYWIDYAIDPSCTREYSVMVGETILPHVKTTKLFEQLKTAMKSATIFFRTPLCKKAIMSFIR